MSTVLDDPIEKPICKVVSFNLRILDFVLHTSVRIGIYLQCLSNEKKTDEYRELTLEGEEYLAWGTDDNYLSEIVKSKLPSLL